MLQALQDPARADQVDPSSYSFRLYVSMETGDARYADKVNSGMWIGSGMRKGAQVIYEYVFFDIFNFTLPPLAMARVC